jgi:hypothetical protein
MKPFFICRELISYRYIVDLSGNVIMKNANFVYKWQSVKQKLEWKK